MTLNLSYMSDSNADWVLIPCSELRKFEQTLPGRKCLKRVLSDGKVETFPGHSKVDVGREIEAFLQQRKIIKNNRQYVLVEESNEETI